MKNGPPSAAASEILDAGLQLVAQQGFGALTLRPLAERSGVSVATVTHHLGAKDEVLARVVDHAHALDCTFFGAWMERARSTGNAITSHRLVIVEQAFLAWMQEARPRAILFSELIQSVELAPEVRVKLRHWSDWRRQAWTTLAGDGDLGMVLAAYLVDETAYSISLNESGAYRMLRSLCLNRLFRGPDELPSGRSAALALFRHLQSELAPGFSVVDAPAVADSDKKTNIAIAAGQLIVRHGVEHLTHRAVATAADVPASTVVYHFGAREDLALAGLEAVIRNFREWLQNARASTSGLSSRNDASHMYRMTRDLVRTTHSIAVAAARSPTLRPHAADMRRRRGENVGYDDLPGLSVLPRNSFDQLTAQVTSVVTFGARMHAMAMDEDEQAAVERTLDALGRVWSKPLDT